MKCAGAEFTAKLARAELVDLASSAPVSYGWTVRLFKVSCSSTAVFHCDGNEAKRLHANKLNEKKRQKKS